MTETGERRRQARRDMEKGASVVEYALLVALIALVCLMAVQFFGGRVSDSFSQSGSTVESA